MENKKAAPCPAIGTEDGQNPCRGTTSVRPRLTVGSLIDTPLSHTSAPRTSRNGPCLSAVTGGPVAPLRPLGRFGCTAPGMYSVKDHPLPRTARQLSEGSYNDVLVSHLCFYALIIHVCDYFVKRFVKIFSKFFQIRTERRERTTAPFSLLSNNIVQRSAGHIFIQSPRSCPSLRTRRSRR